MLLLIFASSAIREEFMSSGKGFLIGKASLLLLAAFVFLQIEPAIAPPPLKNDLAIDKNPAPVEKSVEVGAESAEKPAMSPKLASAAAQNLQLKTNIGWDFGGKRQQGWQIYEPLVQETIKTKADARNGEFAAALSERQKSLGLLPSGILDESTFRAFVADWQSRRLKQRTPALPEELVGAAPDDFYDPGRAAELRQIERETYAAYKKMVAAAAQDKSLNLKTNSYGALASGERFLKIVSSHRSKEYQNQLRAASPNSGRAALAVNFSPHFTGRALDIYVGGEPVSTEDQNRLTQINTPVYKWLIKNAAQFGFRPYFYEPWHWEYVGAAE